jgi:hypothetical protein
MELMVKGVLQFTTYLEFSSDGVTGRIIIFHAEDCESGYPEVEFDSGMCVGEGTPTHIFKAIKLAKSAMAEYQSINGWTGEFAYSSFNDDGHGNRREKFYKKIFPNLINLGII